MAAERSRVDESMQVSKSKTRQCYRRGIADSILSIVTPNEHGAEDEGLMVGSFQPSRMRITLIVGFPGVLRI